VAVNRQRFSRVQTLAQEAHLTISQIALAYLLSQPFVTVPVVGCKTAAHLQDTVAAAAARLTPLQIAYLERGQHPEGGLCPA
jgi:aryl-alcohol dehydrogenase-like predicted oxidoreductase